MAVRPQILNPILRQSEDEVKCFRHVRNSYFRAVVLAFPHMRIARAIRADF